MVDKPHKIQSGSNSNFLFANFPNTLRFDELIMLQTVFLIVLYSLQFFSTVIDIVEIYFTEKKNTKQKIKLN